MRNLTLIIAAAGALAACTYVDRGPTQPTVVQTPPTVVQTPAPAQPTVVVRPTY